MFGAIRSLLHDLTRSLRDASTGARRSGGGGSDDLAHRHRDTFASTRMSHLGGSGPFIVSARPIGTKPGDPPISRTLPLPGLTHLQRLDAADWLRESLTTFAMSVASFLPGHFPAYARVYHPFYLHGGPPQAYSSWRDLPALAGQNIDDPLTASSVAMDGVRSAQALTGTPTLSIIEALVEHLRPATATPGECYFALWEGFGSTAVPEDLLPKLELPNRAYHVFAGPIAAAQTSYDAYPLGYHDQFANLWWPADHTWCVATEVDSAWTHVGGSRACIDAVLADPRLESVETSAHAPW